MKRRPRRAAGRMWKPRVLGHYWLVQLPGTALLLLILLVLKAVFALPLWVVAAVLGVWIGKDALLYPLLWRSFDAGFPTLHSMIGERGVAARRIDPAGHARVRGELWRAELASGAPPIDEGEPLVVESTRGLTLLVRGPRE